MRMAPAVLALMLMSSVAIADIPDPDGLDRVVPAASASAAVEDQDEEWDRLAIAASGALTWAWAGTAAIRAAVMASVRIM